MNPGRGALLPLPCLIAAAAIAVLLSTVLSPPAATAAEKSITLASTTSTDNSGLFAYLLPVFEAESGIRVKVIAVGTGQAISLARNGDADVLLVHDRKAEVAFVESGGGLDRRDVMYNDFVIVGPRADPAGIAGMGDVVAALSSIAAARATFVSRGDDSGTHRAERRLWDAARVDVSAASGTWYRETGSGMGATLNTASAMSAYALSDRATWLSFRNRGKLEIAVQRDPRLFNQYGVIVVNPARHPHVRAPEGRAFIDWLTSVRGQAAIAEFTVEGEQLFFPNYEAPNPERS
jgi:tungstate transport system substrate-binding protein